MLQSKVYNLGRYNTMLWCAFLFTMIVGGVQAQTVQSSIDTATIKIGEQITYHLQVQADSSATVNFPHGQTFVPLEMVDSTAIDTFYKKGVMRLKRQYALTQFDSGAYSIPPQKIVVNGRAFYTDSFAITVQPVVVDTTKQQLYSIKPAIAVELPFRIAHWIWWLLGGLAFLALIIYLFIRTRKKIIEKKRELPPYEKAIQTLKKLDEGQLMESGRVKEYYSSLSEAVKHYVDEKIDDRALESTTSELVALLRAYKDDKSIYLKPQVIDSLEAILRRADLAKFAGIRTDKLTAREDRQSIEANISAFDQAIPEPTEEELMKDEAYRQKQEKKRHRRKIYIRTAIGAAVVLIGLSVFIALKGVNYAKNLVLSHPTEELFQGDWMTSEYGTLGMSVTTPEVLVREMDSVQKIYPDQAQAEERFSFGNHGDNLFVEVINVRFKKSSKIDSVNVGDLLDLELAKTAISNVTFKHKDFTTLEGEKGQKVFGTFTYQLPQTDTKIKKTYTFLLFNEQGGLQELLITYNADDQWGQRITERVVNSVEFNFNDHD